MAFSRRALAEGVVKFTISASGTLRLSVSEEASCGRRTWCSDQPD